MKEEETEYVLEIQGETIRFRQDANEPEFWEWNMLIPHKGTFRRRLDIEDPQWSSSEWIYLGGCCEGREKETTEETLERIFLEDLYRDCPW